MPEAKFDQMTRKSHTVSLHQLRSRHHRLTGDVVHHAHTADNIRYAKSALESNRFHGLALPKQSKSAWETSFWPELRWGNQDPIRPISRYALIANPSERITKLALQKANFRDEQNHIPQHAFSCGRSSPIWKVTQSSLMARPTDHVLKLAKHKEPPNEFVNKMDRPIYAFSCGRSSPIWEVKVGSNKTIERPSTTQLSRAKATHADYKPPRQVQSAVTQSSKNYVVSEGISQLCKAKYRYPEQIRSPEWEVSSSAKTTNASNKVVELSKAKGVVDGYQAPRDVKWPVSQASLSTMASPRIQELSKPIKRETMDHVQFNPDAFIVTQNALKAKASKRLEELSEPLERLRQK